MADTNSDTETGTGQAAAGSRDVVASEAGAERKPPQEIGGRDGPEPTRFGDWEKAGRCIDF